jgi:hypothetical protein
VTAPVSTAARTPASIARQTFRLIGGALDGFVVGFTVAYVFTTAMSGLGRGLGLGPVVDVIVTTGATCAVLALLWGIFVGVIVACGWIRDRLAVALERTRLPRPLAKAIVLPFRIVAAVPKLGVALMAAILIVIYVIVPVGVGSFIAPDGVLAPWLWFAGFAGAGVGLAWTALRGLPGNPGVARRTVAIAGSLAAIAITTWAVAIAVWPGSTDHLVRPGVADDGTNAPTTLEDPGAPGPYAVSTFSYGSGTDRRPEYGAEVLLHTPTVDGSRAIDPLGGFADEARRLLWGFGTDALPLNARVWMPDGDGPFPLVLVVHGNHAMGTPSEAGYAYLGEHLASRGFITASVDENFLNGSWAGDWEGAEQDVRAWLLLHHLDQWRTWNADPSSPVAGKVDLDRVALVGHSRGGEAASIAASWAGLKGVNPTLQPWPDDLRVRAVVAIAPSDGQFGPVVRLEGVDLLELTGGHDADARGWSGIRQYNRTTVAEGGFKAAMYATRANHGQFNTEWGSGDHGRWSGALLNLAPLPSAAEQEDVAKTSISAFLEASLHGETGYRAFFRRPMAGREWLPDDVYLVRSDDGSGTDLVTMTMGGQPAQGLEIVREGIAGPRVMVLPLRALQDTQEGTGATLSWAEGAGDARWGVRGLAGTPAGTTAVGDGAELRLDLATATGSSAEPNEAAPDLSIEAVTTDGVRVALPLRTWGTLPPPLPAILVKNDIAAMLAAIGGLDLSLRTPAEQVVRSYAIPLAAFAAADPEFDPARLDGVALRIPRTGPGSVTVTGLRLAPPPGD